MIQTVAIKAAIEMIFVEATEPIDFLTKALFLNILDLREKSASVIMEAVMIDPEDDSVNRPFDPSKNMLTPKPVELFLGNRLAPCANQTDIDMLKKLGFDPVKTAEIPNERKRVYIDSKGITIAFAKGKHGNYGILGPAVNKNPAQLELYNQCDYWVHARYKEGEKGLIDGAAFDIRQSKILGQGSDLTIEGSGVIEDKSSTWFKVNGLDKIEVQN